MVRATNWTNRVAVIFGLAIVLAVAVGATYGLATQEAFEAAAERQADAEDAAEYKAAALKLVGKLATVTKVTAIQSAVLGLLAVLEDAPPDVAKDVRQQAVATLWQRAEGFSAKSEMWDAVTCLKCVQEVHTSGRDWSRAERGINNLLRGGKL